MQKWPELKKCDIGTCVTVRWVPGKVMLGDSKNPDRPEFEFTVEEYVAFRRRVRRGRGHRFLQGLAEAVLRYVTG